MKKTHYTILTFFFGGGLFLFLASCGCESERSFDGLKLVAQYKPLDLYIYAATSSTNEFPDLIVRERNDPIYIRQTSSNETDITHFEKFNGVLESHYDNNGKLTWRAVRYYDGYNAKYTYFDTNGDGLFDFWVGWKSRPVAFVRSNLCWVPFKPTLPSHHDVEK